MSVIDWISRKYNALLVVENTAVGSASPEVVLRLGDEREREGNVSWLWQEQDQNGSGVLIIVHRLPALFIRPLRVPEKTAFVAHSQTISNSASKHSKEISKNSTITSDYFNKFTE